MASDSLTTTLRRVAKCCGELAAATEWYRFGSTRRGLNGQDVDLLVVYEHRDPARANALREAIAGCEPPEPLDLMLLLPEEAEAFDFIVEEGCEQIWP